MLFVKELIQDNTVDEIYFDILVTSSIWNVNISILSPMFILVLIYIFYIVFNKFYCSVILNVVIVLLIE